MRLRSIIPLAFASVALTACLDTTTTGPSCSTYTQPAMSGDTVTTASGLTYVESKVGEGAEATDSSTVTLHYIGYLQDGTLFDATTRGQPARFSLKGVIPGFREGVSGMQAGGVRRLIIPPALGYGSETGGPCLPANSTLLFDVELVNLGGL